MTIEGELPLEIHVIKPGGTRKLLNVIDDSPTRGPFPRYGEYLGNGEVRIPHFFRNETTEQADNVEPDVGFGDRVLVYTQGE